MYPPQAKSDEHVEHRLIFTDLHARYLAIFEGVLESFLLDIGCSKAAFFAQCKVALEDQYCALFEEHEHHWFVDALLACLDYDRFFGLMVDESRKHDGSSRK